MTQIGSAGLSHHSFISFPAKFVPVVSFPRLPSSCIYGFLENHVCSFQSVVTRKEMSVHVRFTFVRGCLCLVFVDPLSKELDTNPRPLLLSSVHAAPNFRDTCPTSVAPLKSQLIWEEKLKAHPRAQTLSSLDCLLGIPPSNSLISSASVRVCQRNTTRRRSILRDLLQGIESPHCGGKSIGQAVRKSSMAALTGAKAALHTGYVFFFKEIAALHLKCFSCNQLNQFHPYYIDDFP